MLTVRNPAGGAAAAAAAAANVATSMPRPVHQYEVFSDAPKPAAAAAAPAPAAPKRHIPSYPHRVNWVPRTEEDFGDGGAYPEIHVAQYPRGMGRQGKRAAPAGVVPVQVGQGGEVKYDAIVTAQHSDKKVYGSFTDLIEVRKTEDQLQRPDEEAAKEAAARTKAALQAIVDAKTSAARPVIVPKESVVNPNDAKYIRYTPSEVNGGAAQQRVIRMVEAAVDPLEPAKFKHKKAVRGPPSPPVPVQHSPPRKITVADQKAYNIPPCISNWKNAKGYVIPLDKRLAADGRSLQQVTVNDKFATVAEALYIAEREARDEVAARAKLREKLKLKEREQEEEALRAKAARARAERAGLAFGDQDGGAQSGGEDDRRSEAGSASDGQDEEAPVEGETPQEAEARRQRDRLRMERRRERERDIRLEKLGKKTKTKRDMDRDVSEKIALGMHTAGQGGVATEVFDNRLFSGSQGVGSGFGEEDEYNVFTKPLFHDKGNAAIYVPRKGDAEIYGDAEEQYNKLRDTSRFRPDKDFEGVDRTSAGGRKGAPVQFEMHKDHDEFSALTSSHTTETRRSNALDGIGQKGAMMAAAGGGFGSGGGSHDELSDRNIRFRSAGTNPGTGANSVPIAGLTLTRSPSRSRSRSPIRRRASPSRSRSPPRRRSPSPPAAATRRRASPSPARRRRSPSPDDNRRRRSPSGSRSPSVQRRRHRRSHSRSPTPEFRRR